jgi:hypothetical protein
MLLALAACSSSGTGVRPAWPVGTTSAGARVVTGALGGRQQAELDLVSGATTVVVRSADLGDELFRTSTPVGAKVAPAADVAGDTVRLSLRDVAGGQGAAEIDVQLNAGVRWRINLDGGATEETVDLGGGHLDALDFGAGSSRIEAVLPDPRGTVPVRMAGGASTFDLHLPAGIPAQVLLSGGAGQATIDGAVHTGIAGGTVYTPSDWGSATNRYTVDNSAGVSALTLDRT